MGTDPAPRWQQRAGTDHIAPSALPLPPEAKPEERRSLAVYVSGLLDEPGRDTGGGLSPDWGTVGQHGFDLVLAQCMRRHEVRVDQVVAPEDVQKGKGQGGIAAGKGLQVQVSSLRCRGAYRIDHNDLPWRLAQPVLMGVWSYCSASTPAIRQIVSGVTSVAPRRWKKRMGKKEASSEMVLV